MSSLVVAHFNVNKKCLLRDKSKEIKNVIYLKSYLPILLHGAASEHTAPLLNVCIIDGEGGKSFSGFGGNNSVDTSRNIKPLSKAIVIQTIIIIMNKEMNMHFLLQFNLKGNLRQKTIEVGGETLQK